MDIEKATYDLREKKALRSSRQKRVLYWGFVLLILMIELLLLVFIGTESDFTFYLDLLSIVLLCIAVLLGYRDLFVGMEKRSAHSLEVGPDLIDYQRSGMNWSLPVSNIISFREKDTRIDLIDRKDEVHSLDLGDMRLEEYIPFKKRLEQMIEKNKLNA